MTLCLRSPLLSGLGFTHGFSLRAGGASLGPYESLNLGRTVGDDPIAVAENLRRLGEELGFEHVYEVNQVHGAHVERVDRALAPHAYRTRDADALVGHAPLGIRVADCAAVLVADPASGAVAAAHAGWRGVVGGVLPHAVRALCELHDSEPAQLAAAVFPCIGLDAFEVGEDVAVQIAAATERDVVRPAAQGGKPHVDLQRAVQVQLAAAGVGRIELVAGCTYSDARSFYSFRRDRGVTGRHLAVILPRC